MKHWHETASILDRVAHLAAAGVRAAIATVVRISGSAYGRPGAKFLVSQDGATFGGVSGGCLEADVRAVALEVLRKGPPRLLALERNSPSRLKFRFCGVAFRHEQSRPRYACACH